jgi:hypothetical protein
MTTVIDRIVTRLKEARESATLERASFGFSTELVSSNPHFEEPIVSMPIDEFIKGKVKLHHDTWIVAPLDEAIALLEANQEMLGIIKRLAAKLNDRAMLKDLQRLEEIATANRKAEARAQGVY